MQRLSTFFNPEATAATQQDETEDAPATLEAAVEDDKLGRDTVSMAIDHLFGDLAFFCQDKILEDKSDVVLYSDSTEYETLKAKLDKMHILDSLDYLNNEKNIMKEDTRAGLLRECIQELKGMLPNTYDEAWNHPDEKFQEQWRIAIRKELKSLVEI